VPRNGRYGHVVHFTALPDHATFDHQAVHDLETENQLGSHVLGILRHVRGGVVQVYAGYSVNQGPAALFGFSPY